jgi:hypothetical protein
MNKPPTDCVLDYMLAHRDTIPFTLESYVQINWAGDKRLEDLEAEELSMLPPELFPEPVSKLVM